MPKSMTAFGRAEIRDTWGQLSCELRSVNHRYLEVSVRLPEELRAIEASLREKIAAACQRGKVECNLRLRLNPQTSTEIEINQGMAMALIKACEQLEAAMPNATHTSALDVLRWPGVVKEGEQDLQPMLQAALALMDQVLTDFLAARDREGEGIAQLLTDRCQAIAQLVADQRQRYPETVARIQDKLRNKISELQLELDSNRLEQELVYIAQKMDVDEELDRLDTHLKEARRVLKLKEPVGRRLDFLMQEFNREANTLGSKSNDALTSQTAIDLKVLIEQMREQVQNLE